jgi:hypothetical protein
VRDPTRDPPVEFLGEVKDDKGSTFGSDPVWSCPEGEARLWGPAVTWAYRVGRLGPPQDANWEEMPARSLHVLDVCLPWVTK